jgi:hypothetical protein
LIQFTGSLIDPEEYNIARVLVSCKEPLSGRIDLKITGGLPATWKPLNGSQASINGIYAEEPDTIISPVRYTKKLTFCINYYLRRSVST